MKAAVFDKVGQPLRIDTVPDPSPGPSDLVIRVKNSGICGSDLHLSDRPDGLPAGAVMGHEFCGEIVAVGQSAPGDWREGERVCALPLISCGTCAPCLSGDSARCAAFQDIGVGTLPGAYAEYVRVSAYDTLRLPDALNDKDGAAVEPLAVGLHAVHKAKLERGENVLIIGAGPIGLATAMWSRFFGARHVVVSERAAGRLVLAEKYGATGTIDAGSENVRESFQDLTGAKPDVVFECVGVPGVLQECINMAPVYGRIVVVGVCMQQDQILPVRAIVRELQLNFVYCYRRQDFQFTIDMLAGGRVSAHDMVTGTVGFDEFPATFEALKTPTDMCKVQLAL